MFTSIEETALNSVNKIEYILDISPITFSVPKDGSTIVILDSFILKNEVLHQLYDEKLTEFRNNLTGTPSDQNKKFYEIMQKLHETGLVLRKVAYNDDKIQHVEFGTKSFYKRFEVEKVCPFFGQYFCGFNTQVMLEKRKGDL